MLAAFGIYGVMSFVVAQRMHELGLRMALGAGRTRVVREVIRQGMMTAIVGIVIGTSGAGAYAVGRAMQGIGTTSAQWIRWRSPPSPARFSPRPSSPVWFPLAGQHQSIRWRLCGKTECAQRRTDEL